MNDITPIKKYNKEEVKELLKNDTRLVYVDTGNEEAVARYEDIADVIVDINYKLGSTDLKIYDYNNPSDGPIITTIGFYLDKCDKYIRNDMIGQLVELQKGGKKKIKDYKIIDEDLLEDVIKDLNDDEMER